MTLPVSYLREYVNRLAVDPEFYALVRRRQEAPPDPVDLNELWQRFASKEDA